MRLINEDLLPDGINKVVFDKIEDDVFTMFDECELNIFDIQNLNITVEISPLTPNKKYGDYSLESAKAKILKEIGVFIIYHENDEFIKDIANSKTNDELKENVERLFDRYSAIVRNDLFEKKKKELFDIIDRVYFYRDILGKYAYKSDWISCDRKAIYKSRIILYINNITRNLEDGYSLVDGLREVMAHEYFHMYHHYAGYERNNYEFDERKDYLSDVVRETLATASGHFVNSGKNLKHGFGWRGDVLSDPYCGYYYFYQYLKSQKQKSKEYQFLPLDECLKIGMNNWLLEVMGNTKLYYQIANKGIGEKKESNRLEYDGVRLKAGNTFKAKSSIDLLESRFHLKASTYDDGRIASLDNDEAILFISKKDIDEGKFVFLDSKNILCHKKSPFFYLKTTHIFVSEFDNDIGCFEYLGSFLMKLNGTGNEIFVREKGKEMIRRFDPRLKISILNLLLNGFKECKQSNRPNESNELLAFTFDKYNPPKIDINDNFLKALREMIDKKGISFTKMYEICGLDRDNTKQYFNEKKYIRNDKKDYPGPDLPFVVPSKFVYKICLGLKLSPADAKRLMDLAKPSKSRYYDMYMRGFVLECLKDKDLLALDGMEYRWAIDSYLDAVGKKMVFEC